MAKKKAPESTPLPVVRVAPLGELKAYTLSEHELDRLARGAPVSDLQTIGYCLLSAALTLAATLFSTTMSDRTFIVLVCSLIASLLGGGICTVLGWRLRVPLDQLVKEIKGRMPLPAPIQQVLVEEISAAEAAVVHKSAPSVALQPAITPRVEKGGTSSATDLGSPPPPP